MIAEADSMKFNFQKNKNNYPKYFVIRKVQMWKLKPNYTKIL